MKDERFIEIAKCLLISNNIFLYDEEEVIDELNISKEEVLDFQEKVVAFAYEQIIKTVESMKNE